MPWPPHWHALTESVRIALEAELQKELQVGHPLFGVPVKAIGQRDNQDDVLFQVLDGSGRVADIHMTYEGKGAVPPCPWCGFCENLDAWTKLKTEDGGSLEDTP
jgi:hypothetical protein